MIDNHNGLTRFHREVLAFAREAHDAVYTIIRVDKVVTRCKFKDDARVDLVGHNRQAVEVKRLLRRVVDGDVLVVIHTSVETLCQRFCTSRRSCCGVSGFLRIRICVSVRICVIAITAATGERRVTSIITGGWRANHSVTCVEHLFDDEVFGGGFRRLDVGESTFALATAQSEGEKREERIENLFHCGNDMTIICVEESISSSR